MQFAFLFLLICHLATQQVFSRWVGQRRLVNGTESKNAYETIETVLERVAGVFYNDSNRAKYGRNLDKTVVMTGCNHGFLNHLMNFKCFADRLGIKFLVVALDKRTHEFIRLNTSVDSIYMQYADVTEESTEFRSKQFNLITTRKKEAVHDVLKLGYDVLFSDTDVAIVRDPFPYLLWANVDYVHSLNCICKLVCNNIFLNFYWYSQFYSLCVIASRRLFIFLILCRCADKYVGLSEK